MDGGHVIPRIVRIVDIYPVGMVSLDVVFIESRYLHLFRELIPLIAHFTQRAIRILVEIRDGDNMRLYPGVRCRSSPHRLKGVPHRSLVGQENNHESAILTAALPGSTSIAAMHAWLHEGFRFAYIRAWPHKGFRFAAIHA